MGKILIVGIGNLLREDDALGRLAARQLGDLYAGDDSITVVDCHQLTPELADAVAAADTVLFLDAARTGTPGTLTITDISPAVRPGGHGVHHLTPTNLITLTEQLHRRSPRALLLTVTGRQFGLGDCLSEDAEQGVRRMVDRLVAIVSVQTFTEIAR